MLGPDVLIIQPHGCDEDEYWGSVDDDPSAVVHVQVLDDDDNFESFVFSTRAKADAWLSERTHRPAMISVLIIDDPEYGNRMDA